MVEHCLREAGVGGSNPLAPTNYSNDLPDGLGQSAEGEKNPPRLKYISRDRDRHGNTRVYFHKGRHGKKVRIRAREGSEGFDAIYAALLLNKTPEPPKKNIHGAFVYVIGSKHGPYKIGVTSNVGTRLSDLQVGNSRRLVVRHVCMVPDMGAAREMELALHHRFAAVRRMGEWFCVTVTAVKAAICEIAWNAQIPIRQAQVPPPRKQRKSICRLLSPEHNHMEAA